VRRERGGVPRCPVLPGRRVVHERPADTGPQAGVDREGVGARSSLETPPVDENRAQEEPRAPDSNMATGVNGPAPAAGDRGVSGIHGSRVATGTPLEDTESETACRRFCVPYVVNIFF
jgi:hypothetical protein